MHWHVEDKVCQGEPRISTTLIGQGGNVITKSISPLSILCQNSFAPQTTSQVAFASVRRSHKTRASWRSALSPRGVVLVPGLGFISRSQMKDMAQRGSHCTFDFPDCDFVPYRASPDRA